MVSRKLAQRGWLGGRGVCSPVAGSERPDAHAQKWVTDKGGGVGGQKAKSRNYNTMCGVADGRTVKSSEDIRRGDGMKKGGR